jgi:hypothetical protein
VWVIGVLTANCLLTVLNLPETATVKVIVTQDGTGSRTLSVTDGDATEPVTVTSTASARTIADVVFYPEPPTGSAYADEVLADNPVSYWRLGEPSGTIANDEQGVNDGTYVGSPTLGQTGGIAGDSDTSVLFNPATSEITVADSASLDVGDVFTLECWVNRNSVVGSSGGLFDKGSGAFTLEDVGSGQWRFEKGATSTICYSTTNIPSTGWHHIVATKNGATVKLYLDGADVTDTVTNATITNNGTQLQIGRSGNGRWYGYIDEVAIYPTALSGARVAAHYAAGT